MDVNRRMRGERKAEKRKTEENWRDNAVKCGNFRKLGHRRRNKNRGGNTFLLTGRWAMPWQLPVASVCPERTGHQVGENPARPGGCVPPPPGREPHRPARDLGPGRGGAAVQRLDLAVVRGQRRRGRAPRQLGPPPGGSLFCWRKQANSGENPDDFGCRWNNHHPT